MITPDGSELPQEKTSEKIVKSTNHCVNPLTSSTPLKRLSTSYISKRPTVEIESLSPSNRTDTKVGILKRLPRKCLNDSKQIKLDTSLYNEHKFHAEAEAASSSSLESETNSRVCVVCDCSYTGGKNKACTSCRSFYRFSHMNNLTCKEENGIFGYCSSSRVNGQRVCRKCRYIRCINAEIK